MRVSRNQRRAVRDGKRYAFAFFDHDAPPNRKCHNDPWGSCPDGWLNYCDGCHMLPRCRMMDSKSFPCRPQHRNDGEAGYWKELT